MPASTLEILGAKTEELANLNQEYNNLLNILAGVAAGTIAPSRLTVDLTARRWSVSPGTPQPSENGYEARHAAVMRAKGDLPPGSASLDVRPDEEPEEPEI